MSGKTVIKTIRINQETWDELSKHIENVSEFIRDAINEKWEREGRAPLPGDVGERGVRHDYQERKQDTP